MLEEMKLKWKLWLSNYKAKHFMLKLAVSILLIGLAFRFFFFRSTGISPVSETPFVAKPELPEAPTYRGLPVSMNSLDNGDQIPHEGNWKFISVSTFSLVKASMSQILFLAL